MKKHHLINSITGKCFCGIESTNQSIAFNDGDNWYDSMVYPIDHTNYKEMLCINCMKQFDIDLIDQFEMNAFLIDYNNRIPNGKRSMKFFKRQARLNRKSIDRTKPAIKEVSNQSPASIPSNEQAKSTSAPIIQSAKGKARAAKKAANQSKANQSLPKEVKATIDKCKIISKAIEKELIDKPKDAIIELIDEIKKPLIDLSNGPVTIKTELIETVDPSDDWTIGDPINDDEIFELLIGDDWKLIRHNKKLNQWKFVNRSVVKGIPKWIDDSEWIDYKEASQLVIDGYCE